MVMLVMWELGMRVVDWVWRGLESDDMRVMMRMLWF
jgi:hypothetical protein